MKLGFLEIAGFRGFKDRVRFDFPTGFVVLTGRNGAGKSTVLDAFDYVLTGTINKYSVTAAKGGGLDDHIWWVGEGLPTEHFVRLGLIDENGEELVITRSRERGLDTPQDLIAARIYLDPAPVGLGFQALVRTSLIRDEMISALSLDLPEQARFAAVRDAIGGLTGFDHTKRTSALIQAATLARTDQAQRVSSAQGELGRTLSALTEARSFVASQADVAEAARVIGTAAPDLGGSYAERVENIRRLVADRKQSYRATEDAIAVVERLQGELHLIESEARTAEISAARDAVTAAQRAKQQADSGLSNALRLATAESESDALTSHLVGLLDHGEAVGLQGGRCPLCTAERRPEEFDAAISSARLRLAERGRRAERAAASVRQSKEAVATAEKALSIAQERVTTLEEQRSRVVRELETVSNATNSLSINLVRSDSESARNQLLHMQEETARLEHAIFILEASSAHDRVASLETQVERLRAQVDEETAKLDVAERAVEAARLIDHAAKEVANQILTEQFDTVMPLLKDLYRRLRPHVDWREIEIDFGGRVRASLNFSVGDGRNPQFLFSSGQRRAAGIAFLLAIHLSRPWCRLRALLLDDPIQHIDDYRALNLVEVLSAIRKTGRQVIVAVEDTALADVLCRRLRSTATEGGRRFEMVCASNGSASIDRVADITPFPRESFVTATA